MILDCNWEWSLACQFPGTAFLPELLVQAEVQDTLHVPYHMTFLSTFILTWDFRWTLRRHEQDIYEQKAFR